MKTCNPTYAEQIPDLIWRATGALPVRLIPIPTVPDTIVYEAQLPVGAVIFKAIDPEGRDPDGIGLEAWMCEQVCALGVPTPQVLTVDTSHSLLPASYFVMEKARGQPLNSLQLRSSPQCCARLAPVCGRSIACRSSSSGGLTSSTIASIAPCKAIIRAGARRC